MFVVRENQLNPKGDNMQITQRDLIKFATLCGKCEYNAKNKETYRLLGRRILKAIVEQVGLKKGEFEIRWNAGGIAVDGDHVLHTDSIISALASSKELLTELESSGVNAITYQGPSAIHSTIHSHAKEQGFECISFW